MKLAGRLRPRGFTVSVDLSYPLRLGSDTLDSFGQQGVDIYQLMIAIKRILEITCSVNTVPGWRSYVSPDPVGSLHMTKRFSSRLSFDNQTQRSTSETKRQEPGSLRVKHSLMSAIHRQAVPPSLFHLVSRASNYQMGPARRRGWERGGEKERAHTLCVIISISLP
jgi:hypothetical protein